MALKSRSALPRNPGPRWGFAAMILCCRILPKPLISLGAKAGSAIAYALMPEKRRYSRAYLATILGRKPRLRDGLRHFAQFSLCLVSKIRAGIGETVRCEWASEADAQAGAVLHGTDPVILGTFHVGASDLLGFYLHEIGREVSMVRMRMENSGEIRMLQHNAAGKIRLVEVEEGEDVIFTLRDILEAGGSLALQCDRFAHAAKHEAFFFLGHQRLFPVSIYRLAELYRRPVLFCIAIPNEDGMQLRVRAYPAFLPPAVPAREFRLQAARHFQGVLNWLEDLLREYPYLWFNFLPLNPVPRGLGLGSLSREGRTQDPAP